MASRAALESPTEDDKELGELITGKKCLVVEDNRILRELTKRFLEKYGVSVKTACDGEEALGLLAENVYDFVLSDIYMPNINGHQLVSEMRARKMKTPVIGLTAATLGEESDVMLTSGANAVLNKPLDQRAFASAIKSLLTPQ